MIAAASVLAFACNKEREADDNGRSGDGFVTLHINAVSEDTKTTLGDAVNGKRTISWVKDDEVRIIYGTGASDFQIAKAESDGPATTFTVSVPSGTKTLYAVYPASQFEALSDGTLTVSVPSLQDGRFSSSNIAVAKCTFTSAEDVNFSFKNVCSYLLTDITDASVGRVSVSAQVQALAGKIPVSFTSAGEAEIGSASDTESTIVASGLSLGQCAIAVLPGLNFAEGVTVTFSSAEGEEVSHVSLKKDHSLVAGEVLDTGALDSSTIIAYYASPEGAGEKDGKSFDSAWSVTELVSWLKTADPAIEGIKTPSAPYNIYLADGTYTLPESVATQAKNGRNINFISVGKNAVFTSAESVHGRMLYFSIPAKISFQDVTFSGHNVDGSGAALYFNNPSAGTQETILTGCTFKDNVNAKGLNAALVLANNGVNTLNGCVFQNNTSGGAAAINIDREATVVNLTGCTFKDNHLVKCGTDKDAGALAIGNGTVTVSGCTFEGNVVDEDANGGGAAVWIAMQAIDKPVRFKDNCVFTGNKLNNTIGRGAAVYITKGTDIQFENCSFTGNECTSESTTSYGGAVCVGNFNAHRKGDVNVTFSGCTFDGNKVAGAGENTDFARGAGAIFMTESSGTTSVTLNNCTIQNHVLNNRSGGGIYAEAGKLNIVGGKFADNDLRRTYTGGTGKIRGQGGALEIENAIVSISGGTEFSGNIAGNTGGAIMMPNGYTGTLSIDGAKFTGNQSIDASGGAIAILQSDDVKFTFKNAEFEGNYAKTAGGAVTVHRMKDIDFKDCTFKNNTTISLGGAIYAIGLGSAKNTITVDGCDFTGNHTTQTSDNGAGIGGGAITVSNEGNGICYSNLKVTNSTFKENYSLRKGGAIDFRSSGTCTIDGSLFDGNYVTKPSSGWGGGLNLESASSTSTERSFVSISGSRFIGNHSNQEGTSTDPRGGAIAIGVSSKNTDNYIDVRIDKCYFKGNYACQAGDIRAWDGKTGNISLYLNDCAFEGSHAKAAHGKSMFVYACKDFGMNNCSFRNIYSDDGGAAGSGLVNRNWVDLAATNSVVSNNTLAGRVNVKEIPTDNEGNGGMLVRVEQSGGTYDFINNVIVSTRTSGTCYSIIRYGSNTVNLYSNKLSKILDAANGNSEAALSGGGVDDYNGINWKGLEAYLGGFAWTAFTTAGQEYKSGWTWNGTLATGTPATMTTRGDVKSKIQASNPDFYAWLQTVDGLDKDQKGAARGSSDTDAIWPGAHQN